MAEYKHIIILKEILQNGGYYMVLIKKNHGRCDGIYSGSGDAGCVLDRIFGR